MNEEPRIQAKKITAYIPISIEHAIDLGFPPPPGYVPPPSPPRPRGLRRLRIWWACWKYDARRKLGFWIAGHNPENED